MGNENLKNSYLLEITITREPENRIEEEIANYLKPFNRSTFPNGVHNFMEKVNRKIVSLNDKFKSECDPVNLSDNRFYETKEKYRKSLYDYTFFINRCQFCLQFLNFKS